MNHQQKIDAAENPNTPAEEALSFEECLEDWIIVNWAWEVKNGRE